MDILIALGPFWLIVIAMYIWASMVYLGYSSSPRKLFRWGCSFVGMCLLIGVLMITNPISKPFNTLNVTKLPIPENSQVEGAMNDRTLKPNHTMEQREERLDNKLDAMGQIQEILKKDE